MTILATIESYWQKDEEWVFSFLLKIKQGAIVLEHDVAAFWSWLASHSVEITNDMGMVTKAVQSIALAGVHLPPTVTTSINKMNVAVAALNSAVNAANAGGGVVKSALAAYGAAKSAQRAVAAAAEGTLVAAPAAPVAAPAPAAEAAPSVASEVGAAAVAEAVIQPSA